MWGFVQAASVRSAPLKCISEFIKLSSVYWCDNYLRRGQGLDSLLTVRKDNTFDNLTSNQVGLPAELKHINKRRKRN